MMKAFFRTALGKLLLILVCILSILTAAACAGGADVTVSNDGGDVHLRTEEEAKESIIDPRLRERAFLALDSLLNKDSVDKEYERDLVFRITNVSTGSLWYISDGVQREQMIYSHRFYVHWQQNKAIIELEKEHVQNADSNVVSVFDVYVGMKSVDSSFTLMNRLIRLSAQFGWWIFGVGLAALALGCVSFIALMRVSARRPERDELVPGPLNPVPYDLMLAFGAAVIIGLVVFVNWVVPIDDSGELWMCTGAVVLGLLVLIGLSMSAAARIKQRSLLSNTLIVRIIKLLTKPFIWLFDFLKNLFQNLPLIWKTAAVLGILALLEFIVILLQPHVNAAEFWLELVKWLILIPLILYFALCLRRLQKGGEALAAGDLTYQTETKGLPHDLKKHAEDLNSIGGGMAIAVEERLKSERMKTELITNVSHDLKTPLTSVINYADLIGKESCDNPKITEYSEVLLRQSERLKRLIDDLVEASKASSGDLDVDLVPCDAAVFLQQAAGEYEEKLQQAKLQLIVRQPEEEVRIKADGRRMWRIFDNLMSNIVKYSLSGTRVYLSLEQQGSEAVITFRNTSREPLDMNVEELTERFTRGDSSRNTEGSGLGLAIAKSLTELQGGRFFVAADGDLFKVTLRFPAV